MRFKLDSNLMKPTNFLSLPARENEGQESEFSSLISRVIPQHILDMVPSSSADVTRALH